MRAFWFGTAATVPAGWTRDNDYAGFYVQGHATSAAGTGGSADHVHGIGDHGLTGNPHTHPVEGASTTASSTTHTTGGPSAVLWSLPEHGHVSSTSDPTTITYSDATGVDSAAVAADPPFMRAIVIKPDDALQLLPDDGCALWDGVDVPAGYGFCDGSAGSPDVRNRFFKGAVIGGDGGGVGGSATHVHAFPHKHAYGVHVHAAAAAGDSDSDVLADSQGIGRPRSGLLKAHESVGLLETAGGETNENTGDLGVQTSLPVYVRLAMVQNQTGGVSLEAGTVLVFKGDVGDVPADWVLCDGSGGTVDTVGREIYVASSVGEIGDTGGAAVHRHWRPVHAHTVGSHGHINVAEYTSRVKRADGAVTVGRDAVGDTHSHVWTVGSTAATTQDTAGAWSGVTDVRLSYRDVLFVKYSPRAPSVMPMVRWRRRRRSRVGASYG